MTPQIDVVYKLGIGSKFQNRELKYSLRSLSNFKSLRNVYVVGQWLNLDWLNKESVVHIPALDPMKSNKDGNLVNKIILASFEKDISQQFVNMSDDQLFLKEIDYAEISTPYIDNSLTAWKEMQKLNRWQTRLHFTMERLKERGFKTHCYDSHIPVLIDKENYVKTLFQYNYMESGGLCGNTLYFNTVRTEERYLHENTLARINKPHKPSEILDYCRNKTYLNYADDACNEDMFVALDSLFPEKSKYEK